MYTSILVPLDGSDRAASALVAADLLAERWGARLTVASFLLDVDDIDRAEQLIAAQTASLVHRPASLVRTVAYTVADEIAFEVERHADMLVVMGTKARSHVTPVLGSVADEVLLLTRAPTLLLGPEVELSSTWPSGRIVLCTDGSDLSETVVEPGAAWAEALDLHPWVVTVAKSAPVPAGVGDIGNESNAVAGLAHRVDAGGRSADYEVLHGPDTADELASYGRRYDVALIAMSTHGETGFRRIVTGSTTMETVHRAPCPVLVVPPPADD